MIVATKYAAVVAQQICVPWKCLPMMTRINTGVALNAVIAVCKGVRCAYRQNSEKY